jgi:hypothetical protein
VVSAEELQQAFSDAKLKAHTRALFAAGRFVTDDVGQVVLALPNEPHRQRCEPQRAEVEGAVAAVLGRPFALTLVVQEAPRHGARRPAGEPTDEPADEPVDPAELVDAPAAAEDNPVARLTRAFPGSELIEDR